ncbi:MAG TPA: hypothetical protein VFI44_02905, partial [Ornithinibacter sp.]|nr:hypothetical protein [Ornithinibacter sp.]
TTLLGGLVVLALSVPAAPPVPAQDPGTSGTTAGQVPAQDIVPAPNTGEEPHDPGDRGGALQLGVFALLVVAVGGAVVMVVRQSRRARRA